MSSAPTTAGTGEDGAPIPAMGPLHIERNATDSLPGARTVTTILPPYRLSTSARIDKIALLLPLTLDEPGSWENLVEFARSVARAFTLRPLQNDGKKMKQQDWIVGRAMLSRTQLCFFLGVEMAPEEIEEEKASNYIEELFHRVLSPHKVDFDFIVRTVPIHWNPRVAHAKATRELAKEAYLSDINCDFFMLGLSDEVRLKDARPTAPPLMRQIRDAFEHFHIVTHQTGIGCCALVDESQPSSPTLPILSRTHLKAFGGDVIPADMELNTHLEDFVYEIHFRLGAAELLKDARATRKGHLSPPRLRHPQSARLWSAKVGDVVSEFARVALKSKVPVRTALDIVVPSYRTPRRVIERILELPRPNESLAIRVIVVCDNPKSKEAICTFTELESDYAHDFACKLRLNTRNMGPGFTRNSGLMECPGDYVLFLDDDVDPQPGLLYEYARMIRAFPEAQGFIGRTALPLPVSPRTFGLIRSRICFGWDFALADLPGAQLDWCITANLCVRRNPDITFDPIAFPKGGGGEEVDFCMRLVNGKKTKLLPAPNAAVRHPWWDNGHPNLEHFVCWAKGDRPLIERHKEFAFWNLPDSIETGLLGLTLGPLLALKGTTSMKSVLAFVIAQPIGEVIYEIISLRHLDLYREKGAEFATLTAVFTAAISMCHEYGRFRGHVDRGFHFSSFCRHFNWYGGSEWRKDFPWEERKRLVKRGFVRLLTAWVLAKIFSKIPF